MSREIEFRGLKPSGEFVYGSLVNNCIGLPNGVGQNTKTWIVTSAFGNGGWFNIRGRSYVKPETVGQFTGLLDCNGVKIFEGDIVKSHHNTGSYPVISGECVLYDADGREYGFFVGLIWDGLPFGPDAFGKTNNYEVIGNIHQNSELLK